MVFISPTHQQEKEDRQRSCRPAFCACAERVRHWNKNSFLGEICQHTCFTLFLEVKTNVLHCFNCRTVQKPQNMHLEDGNFAHKKESAQYFDEFVGNSELRGTLLGERYIQFFSKNLLQWGELWQKYFFCCVKHFVLLLYCLGFITFDYKLITSNKYPKGGKFFYPFPNIVMVEEGKKHPHC